MRELPRDFNVFINEVNDTLKHIKVAPEELSQLDHFAIRTETPEEYQLVCEQYAQLGVSHESLVGERFINVFYLHEPIRAGGWIVTSIEVMAPKERGTFYPYGLEHAAFVPLRLLTDFLDHHPDVEFDRENMAPEREPNPIAKYHNTSRGLALEFHPVSLARVVELESMVGPRP